MLDDFDFAYIKLKIILGNIRNYLEIISIYYKILSIQEKLGTILSFVLSLQTTAKCKLIFWDSVQPKLG